MAEIKEGDIVILKSEKDFLMTVTDLLADRRLEAAFWNPSKGEFQTIRGHRDAFQKVND